MNCRKIVLSRFLNFLMCFVACFFILVTQVSVIAESTSPQKSWKVSQKGNIVRIFYGSGSDYPQYAALHLDSSYFRMNYGPNSGWGTSVILFPSFWKNGNYIQGAKINSKWETLGTDIILSISGKVDGLNVMGEVRIIPPKENMISAKVKINTKGDIVIDERRGEAFKLVMLSSMHISDDKWDCQAAYVDSKPFKLPESEWIVEPPLSGEIFSLKGGTSSWKKNAPTIEILLDQKRWITGWVTESKNPNEDNIGFWAASDIVLPSWGYTIIAKQ